MIDSANGSMPEIASESRVLCSTTVFFFGEDDEETLAIQIAKDV